MIDAENLVFDYPSGRALHGVGFVVRAGAVLALVGPNGAGKSTLMRCIAALDVPTEGTVNVLGYDTQKNPREIHAALGYLSDMFGLYDALSVHQALTYAARSRGVPMAETEAAVLAAAARVGLSERLESLAGELSRGLRQRLAIGQTIVHRPRVLLLDEPASGLDPDARKSLSDLILSLATDGMTIVVSSHILSELDDYCTEMLMLDEGRVVGGGVVAVDGKPIAPAAAEDEAEAPAPRMSRIKVSFAVSALSLAPRIEALGMMVEHFDGNDAFLLIAPDAETPALAALVGAGLPVRGFAPVRQTLEAAYYAAHADHQAADAQGIAS
ncbi:MAG: ABC transporter ATP-binding protein [Caulobacteraceae bacterium]